MVFDGVANGPVRVVGSVGVNEGPKQAGHAVHAGADSLFWQLAAFDQSPVVKAESDVSTQGDDAGQEHKGAQAAVSR